MRRLILLLGLRLTARGTFVPEDEVGEKILREKQVRSGVLSSYKTSMLMRSRWLLGDLGPLEGPTSEIGFYRIISAPLPPRHNESQLWENLRFIMTTEPRFERCRKIFVLNRFIDKTLEENVKDYIETQGFEVLILPFHVDEYHPFHLDDTYGLSKKAWNPHLSSKFSRLNARLYVMNNNGARNYALRHGLKKGWAWTLPFDGNCIFDGEKWKKFLQDLDTATLKGGAYVAIPMMRTVWNQSLISSGVPGEHQIAFNRRAKLQFDPTLPYGHRPKVNLLWRLGVPGSWDHWWGDPPFRTDGPCKITMAKECLRTLPLVDAIEAARTVVSTSSVSRLPDGVTGTADEHRSAMDSRQARRDEGAIRQIQHVDALLLRDPPGNGGGSSKPTFFNLLSMETMRRECIATKLLFQPFLPSPTTPTSPPPLVVGAIDQHHCAQLDDLLVQADNRLYREPPYLRPDHIPRPPPPDDSSSSTTTTTTSTMENQNPPPVSSSSSSSSESEKKRNTGGEPQKRRRLGWRLKDDWGGGGPTITTSVVVNVTAKSKKPPSPDLGPPLGTTTSEQVNREQGNRLRSYHVMTNLTLQALAYFYSGRSAFAKKAVAIARHCFVDPKTARVQLFQGTGAHGVHAYLGVIYTKDLVYALDAVSLVRPTRFWTKADDVALRRWCFDYLQKLEKHHDNGGWAHLIPDIALGKCAGRPEDGLVSKLRDHISWYVTKAELRDEMTFVTAISRGGVQHHMGTTYAMILAWRVLVNLGASDLLAKLAVTLQRIATYVDLLVSTTCATPSCVPHAVALEFASHVCQWAFDAHPDFADHLNMCRRKSSSRRRSAHPSAFPILGTTDLDLLILPPLTPAQSHLGYPPFANLLW